MLNCIVKKATQKDATYISLLGRITFSETFGHLFNDKNDLHSYLEDTFSVAKIRSSLTKENNVFWIAYFNELPVGYAKLKKHSPLKAYPNKKVAQLQKIYVLKDFLAHKIGSRLQDALFEEVKNIQAEVLWLAVLQENERAIRFYEKNLFVKHDLFYFSIGKEDFTFDVMVKEF